MSAFRRVGDRMSFVLFILGNIATAAALSGYNNTTDLNLECTNDFEAFMSCNFDAQNCSEYSLRLESNQGYGVKHCTMKLCDSGRCCCSLQITLVLGESHTATLLRGGWSMESKIISITETIKPKKPRLVSVKESNGNFEVWWTKNMKGYIGTTLNASVTFRKKGDTEKVSALFKPLTIDGLEYYEMSGQRLEPSTTYMVSVRSYTDWSGLFSDSSDELECTTLPAASIVLPLAIVIGLSVLAVITSAAIYGCYVKFQRKWQDTVAKCPNPQLCIVHSSKQEVLKPKPAIISSVSIEPLLPDDSKPWLKESQTDTSSGSLQSSGISTGSSCISYANTEPANIIASVQDAVDKALANISPMSSLTINPDSGLFSAPYNPCGDRADTSSGSCGIDNKTYSILLPSFPHETLTARSEVQTQGEMLCDSAYHPSEGGNGICPDQQAPACTILNLPAGVSPPMPTEMSYQQCTADSGRFSPAEHSSLSFVSSGTNSTASWDPASRAEGLDEVVSGASKLNGKTEEASENPLCVPAGSCSFPPVDDDYQPFQNLVKQPEPLLLEKRSVETEEQLSRYPEESIGKMPQSFLSPVIPSFIDNIQGGQCLSELQRPFLSLSCVDQSMPVITESGYQSAEFV